MTVQTDVSEGRAQGNGVATVFSFSPVVIPENGDLEVFLFDRTTGAEFPLTEGAGASNYIISVSSYPGTGSITYPASGGTALTSVYDIVWRRRLDILQETDLGPQGPYDADVQETALDRIIMICQQIWQSVRRSIQFQPTFDITGFDNRVPPPEPNRMFAYNSGGTGFVNVDVPNQSLVDSVQASAEAAAEAQVAAEAAAIIAEAAASFIPTPANPGDNGKFLRAQAGAFELGSPVAGGDVVGPAVATNHGLVCYDGVTGKLVKAGPALGTSGHPLVSAGAGGIPAFGQLATIGYADVSVTEAKIAPNAVGVAKLKREGTAGQILYSGGAGADPSWGAPPAAGEANTASNLGGTCQVFHSKSGVDLRFRGVSIANASSGSGDFMSNAVLSIAQDGSTVGITLTRFYWTGGGPAPVGL